MGNPVYKYACHVCSIMVVHTRRVSGISSEGQAAERVTPPCRVGGQGGFRAFRGAPQLCTFTLSCACSFMLGAWNHRYHCFFMNSLS